MTIASERIRQRLNQQREQVLEAAARHGARNVRMIGSVARGDATTESSRRRLATIGQAL